MYILPTVIEIELRVICEIVRDSVGFVCDVLLTTLIVKSLFANVYEGALTPPTWNVTGIEVTLLASELVTQKLIYRVVTVEPNIMYYKYYFGYYFSFICAIDELIFVLLKARIFDEISRSVINASSV